MSVDPVTRTTTIGKNLKVTRAQGRGANLLRLEGVLDESLHTERLLELASGLPAVSPGMPIHSASFPGSLHF